MQPATEKHNPKWPYLITVPNPNEGASTKRWPYHPFNVYRTKAAAEMALAELNDPEAIVEKAPWAEQMVVVDDN